MKIFEKVKKADGKREIYFCGINVYSYKKRKTLSKYETIYQKRFKGLTYEEERFILEEQFKKMAGYKLNLDNPQSFNEKIQWLKLNYHDPLMTKCADKVMVREYIKEKLGEEYLIPVLGVYDNPDDIDFAALPEKFVLKVNWGSGQNIICTDKSKLNIEETKAQLREWMKSESNHYYDFLEWCYKDIKPKILAEDFIEGKEKKIEYQLFCFHGKVEFILCEINGKVDANKWKRGFYDGNWKKLDFKMGKMDISDVEKPECLNEMLSAAITLSEPFPFVRIDVFEKDQKLKIRELTFYSGNGMSVFEPANINLFLGHKLILPNIKS